MKRVFYLTLIMFIMFAAIACNRQNGTRVTVSNPSDYDRLTELIEISVDSILARENGQVTVLDTISMLIVKNAAGEEIPSQVTYDRKLIFQPSLKAGDKKQFYIDRGVLQKYEPRVWGRLMPERYDDFAWENDRVAFRIY
ncbi:MAG: DUF4861 domain-containing protein, partial [Prevotellaceae bacterium]|nr:DUF4861 domain-containing protein [Prevotellaceae bacterium]